MRYLSYVSLLGLLLIGGGILVSSDQNAVAERFPVLSFQPRSLAGLQPAKHQTCSSSSGDNSSTGIPPQFLVVGGGGAPDWNEISLEKNLRYFQRTLQVFGYNPAQATLLFANGNDGRPSVRYLNTRGQERFKVPEIPNLRGASSRRNLVAAVQKLVQQPPPRAFFYFTGHGSRNPRNLNNNTFNLWPNDDISVQQFSRLLDQLPTKTTVAVVMTQCYSGSFANLIYTAPAVASLPLSKKTRRLAARQRWMRQIMKITAPAFSLG
jgi:hypothetical protein